MSTIDDIVDVVMKCQLEHIEQSDKNFNNPPSAYPETKYKLGDYVEVGGWVSTARGKVVDISRTFHNRMGEWVWGYAVEFDEGQRNPLTMHYIPEGYIKLVKGDES